MPKWEKVRIDSDDMKKPLSLSDLEKENSRGILMSSDREAGTWSILISAITSCGACSLELLRGNIGNRQPNLIQD